jgi:hypothetical protein
MATGYVYPGRVIALDPAGPIVTVPMLAQTAKWGPLPSSVPDLEIGEQVIVTSLGTSRDALVIIGRLPGKTPDITDIPGLAESLAAIDTRVDALQIEQTTDHGVLGEHGERLDDLDAGQLAQNNRLTATETVANGAVAVNNAQNTRLTAVETRATSIEGVNTTQNSRLTALENATPTDTVTDAELAAGLASVRADTVNKVDAKGDLLVGTAADTLGRLALGTTDQILTADTAQTTGMKWTTSPRGLPLALTGATSPTRYVGATSTAGPPSTGTWQNGDFSIDSVGHVWVRAGGAWKGWTKDLDTSVTALDTRMDAQESGDAKNHYWFQNGGAVDPNLTFEPAITGWVAGTMPSPAIATMRTGGYFKLNRAGRWHISLEVFGDTPSPYPLSNGYTQVRVNWPSGAFGNTSDIYQGDHRHAGPYPGCGLTRVRASWSGWVNATQALAEFRCLIFHGNSGPAPGYIYDNFDYKLQLNYLGGA